LSEIDKSEQRSVRATVAVSAIAILVCLFGNLGAIGLVGPDEPRYAWIARAMAETGDWVTPRLYGQPWFEKPILYYWCAGIGFLFHLPAEWAARLPSAIAALAAALALGWLGRKHYGRANSDVDPGLIASLVFATSVAAIGFARAATPDMLFSASIALAMASAASILRGAGELRGIVGDESNASRRDTWALVLFGLFLGLGVLAKGPAAIALAGGAIGLWALATGLWRAAFRVAHPIAIAIFCLVSLPWYVVCAIRNPEFLRVFIFQHNFERYLTPMFQHKQPFWFFGPIVLLALLPWTLLLWPVTEEGLRLWREKSWKDSPEFFFSCWAIFPVVFFSLSQSKLPGYILPAMPPLALLCSVALLRRFQQTRVTAATIATSVAVTWIAFLAIAFYRAQRTAYANVDVGTGPRFVSTAGIIFLLALVVAAATLVVSGCRRKFAAVVLLSALCAGLSIEIVSFEVLPAIDASYSARPHAAFMRNDQRPDRIFTYELRRDWNFGLAFYFHRELPEWSPADPQAAFVLTTPAGLKQIRSFGRVQGALDESYNGILYVPVGPAAIDRQ
jgi:4-amino-4-deoxy-L-arabinose transferase-like glycosyltransferase